MAESTGTAVVKASDVPLTPDRVNLEWTPEHLRAAISRQEQLRTLLLEYLVRAMKPRQHYYWLSEADQKAKKKPSLTKEGALNLIDLFAGSQPGKMRAVPHQPVKEIEPDGHLTVWSRVDIVNDRGEVVATGDGCCSTHESKYAYRWLWPSEVPEKDRAGMVTRTVTTKRGKVKQYRVATENSRDHWNTVLKMSDKRGTVAGALKLPLVSELFTQDLEDLIDDSRGDDETGNGGASPPEGQGPTAPAPAAPEPAVPTGEDEVAGAAKTALQEFWGLSKQMGLNEMATRSLARRFHKSLEELDEEQIGKLNAEMRRTLEARKARPDETPTPTGSADG